MKEETTTEHVPGGLVVETKTVKGGKDVTSPKPLFRYQPGNHLGSVSLELDESGGVISYEEYHPYGTTSYRAVRGDVDADVNRYRFTGMERDEETGLAQHGARYYAAWLGRWASADPIGLGGGINRYAYCRGSPVTLSDTDGMAPTAAPRGGPLVTTGLGSGGRGPTLLLTDGDDQFRQSEQDALAVEDDGVDWVQRSVDEAAHDRAVIDGMAGAIHRKQAMGAVGMLAYAAILFGGPVAIESAIVGLPALWGAGASATGIGAPARSWGAMSGPLSQLTSPGTRF